MEEFTLEEYETLAGILDNTPFQGTIYTLPPALSKLTQLRVKLQRNVETLKKEYMKHAEVQPQPDAS